MVHLRIEKSKSNNSHCKTCKINLIKGELRINFFKLLKESSNFHLKCFKNEFPMDKIKIDEDLLNDKDLNDEIQKYMKIYKTQFDSKFTKKRKYESLVQMSDMISKKKKLG